MLIDNISGLSVVFGKDAKDMTTGQREILATVSRLSQPCTNLQMRCAKSAGKSTKLTTSRNVQSSTALW